MSKQEAEAVVLAVWNGKRREDAIYFSALGELKLDRSVIRTLHKEARRVCRGLGGAVLTPTGGANRRR